MRSILSRICEIWLLSGAHCAFGPPLNRSKKPVEFAVHSPRLLDHAIELGLLLGGLFLEAADLLGSGRIVGAAAVDRRELLLEPLADLCLRCGAGSAGRSRTGRRRRLRRANLRHGAKRRCGQHRGRQDERATLI